MDRFVPAGSGRKAFVFAEVGSPVKSLLFDVFLHEDVYPGADAALSIYDTVLEGVASVNDRSRDIDRFDLAETVQPLGRGVAKARAAEVFHSFDVLRHVYATTGWEGEQFRGYRCRIEYPVYGSQVAMSFEAPPPPPPPT
jgi:hypothetical protein